MNNYEVKHIENKIVVTAAFLKKASKMGTSEYNTVIELRRNHPNYQFEVAKSDNSNRKASKSKNLTYKHMKDYIAALYDEDTEDAKKALATALAALDKVQRLSKIQNNPYLYVRDWFIKTYPECRPSGEQKDVDNESPAA